MFLRLLLIANSKPQFREGAMADILSASELLSLLARISKLTETKLSECQSGF